MVGDGAITLDNEIVRVCKDYFNYCEPSIFAKVTKIHDNTVDIEISTGKNKIPVGDVPVVKPCYGSESLNLALDDRVLLIFQAGSIKAPVVVGKL